jgi:ABC-type sugar transport system substrate-binding protein
VQIGLFLIDAKSLFQGQQRASGLASARATGVNLDVFFAEGESRTQRDQMFAYIRQATPPAAVIVEPVEDTGLRFVAQEALRKGSAWVMLNRTPSWVADVGAEAKGLAFCVTADQMGIGRVQGEQYRALVPQGGTVLYVTGPSLADSTQQRLTGMEETKGPLISTIKLVGTWTEQSGHDAVKAWLETTRGFVEFHLIGAQNDDMALGGKKAAAEMAAVLGKPAWRDLPATGVDGMAEFGMRLVEEKTLVATVIMPPTAGKAVEILAAALRGGAAPPAVTTVPVMSHPHLSLLRAKR